MIKITDELKARVRDHEGVARIEVAPEERSKLLQVEILDDLNVKLKEFGFGFVAIDCQGYKTGSLSAQSSQPESNSQFITKLEIQI